MPFFPPVHDLVFWLILTMIGLTGLINFEIRFNRRAPLTQAGPALMNCCIGRELRGPRGFIGNQPCDNPVTVSLRVQSLHGPATWYFCEPHRRLLHDKAPELSFVLLEDP